MPKVDSLARLTQDIRDFTDARDWEQFHNPKDLAISLSLEAAEVLEHFQWKSEAEVKAYLQEHHADLGEELADVLYWTLKLADKANINLADAFDAKMIKNAAKYPVEKAKGNHKKYTEHE